MIRILHIVGIMDLGGIENLLMNVYRDLDRSKFQFDFLVTREQKGYFDDEILSLGGKIYNIPHLGKVNPIQYKKSVFSFFKNHSEYNIVHCHRDALSAIYLRQAFKANIPCRIAHSHNVSYNENLSPNGVVRTIYKIIMKRKISKYATDLFACSNEASSWLFGKSNYDKVYIVKNGISSKKYLFKSHIRDRIRTELKVDENSLLIGHVGRFDEQKNHKLLIEVFYNYTLINNAAKLCLIGSGPLKPLIESEVQRLGIEDKVHFCGLVDNVNEYLMAFDLFLFPSLYEGLGIALIEAQASGLICIVSNKVPVEAIINKKQFIRCILSVDEWIKQISMSKKELNQNRFNREDCLESVCEKGFDVVQTTRFLSDFYESKNEVNIWKK